MTDFTCLTDLTPRRALGLMFLTTLAVILAALGFEYIGGYQPCPLCYMQRYAYYAVLILAPLGLLADWRQWPAAVSALLALIGVIWLGNAIFGGYHAGVEWGFWPGPTSCTGNAATPPPITLDADAFSKSLETIKVVRCDKPSFRFLGISFAGYNALISAGLAALALLALRTRPGR